MTKSSYPAMRRLPHDAAPDATSVPSPAQLDWRGVRSRTGRRLAPRCALGCVRRSRPGAAGIAPAVAALLLGRSPVVDLFGPRLVCDPLLYAWGFFDLVV